jgi:protein-S-isoprenylcysteine O-methyltransferase Ste14
MIQRIRVPLGFVIAAAVLYFATPGGGSIVAGLPIALGGAVLRALAAGTIRKDSALARTGLYAWTRNPLYLGSILLAAGFAVMSANGVAAALLLIPSLVVYPGVIRNEEAHLARLFPAEFAAYRNRTPRLLPRTRPRFGLWRSAFSWRQYRANREYNTALGFAAATAVLIVKWRLI